MFNRFVRPVLRKLGIDVVRYRPGFPADFEDLHVRICERVRPFTMTSPQRIHGLVEAVRYVCYNGVEGDFVECGVWKGGSVMAMALTLLELDAADRDFYLYDTFAGMSAPTERDVSTRGQVASSKYVTSRTSDGGSEWAYSSLDEVRENVLSTGYPPERIHFVQGKVEDTIPATLPERIALLRLDTDWYESTRHELQHLYPVLSDRGVLILDDYGHWQGSREAADEYFEGLGVRPLLSRLDLCGRISIKT